MRMILRKTPLKVYSNLKYELASVLSVTINHGKCKIRYQGPWIPNLIKEQENAKMSFSYS